jgi:spore coat protein U-like protein
MRITRVAKLFVTAGLALAAASASAQTATDQFTVRAEVQASCALDATDLNFGVYNSNSNKDADTPLVITCTPGVQAAISLSAGSSGNPNERAMRSGNNTLPYQLYTDAARTIPINHTSIIFQLYNYEPSPKTFTIYGRVPSGNTRAAGIYEDVILVTATF